MRKESVDLIVLGAGPGGYAAAFYAADKGRKVVLIEQDERLGGVCLNRGCIPSKALLNAAHVISESKHSQARGIAFGEPEINLDKLRAWKESILNKLSQGVVGLSKRREIEVVQGRGYFEDERTLRVETNKGQRMFEFKSAVIAVGSLPVMPQAFDLGNPRIMTSTEALELEEIPANLLVVGGGYIGMELGTVYATLGSKVVLVEALESILMGADPDLVRPVAKYAEKHFKDVRLKAKVMKMATSGKKIKVQIKMNDKTIDEHYDRVLVSVGRMPNSKNLGLNHAKVEVDEKGFIRIDSNQRTSNPKIYAIGDVAGGVLLAHKATKEGRIAVEALLGETVTSDDMIIPCVVFTDPEVAWCGLTEQEARQRKIAVRVVKMPWSASGRALALDRTDGLTKLIIDPETERILGVGIVGVGAGDLISEGVLALEMGATAKDMAETMHPHPTLSETLMESAETFYGTATHTFSRKVSVSK